jgi:NADH-quinone oxidoreductase subunit J
MELLFYLSAGAAVVVMGLAMITSYVVHALLYAILSLLCVAVAMYSLSAHLAAALEVIVYTGAIMVLFMFAIMLLRVPAMDSEKENLLSKKDKAIGIGVCGIFGLETFLVLKNGFLSTVASSSSVTEIAIALFNTYGFLVEVISFVLLAGLVAAIFVARKFMHHRSIEVIHHDSP